MCSLARLVFACFLALTAVELSAQDAVCNHGRLVPYFGWDATECTDCVIRGPYIEYLKEPRISSIRSDGPAAGRLREFDMLVAVDGLAITTPEAWHRLRDVKAGEMLRFTVSNNGVTRDETIRPTTRCVQTPPPNAGRRIIIVRRRTGTL